MANANDGINTIATGFKNIFLAGVGAMALTGEKTKELVDQLVAKGEITVEQGKQVTADLQQKATAAAKAPSSRRRPPPTPPRCRAPLPRRMRPTAT